MLNQNQNNVDIWNELKRLLVTALQSLVATGPLVSLLLIVSVVFFTMLSTNADKFERKLALYDQKIESLQAQLLECHLANERMKLLVEGLAKAHPSPPRGRGL